MCFKYIKLNKYLQKQTYRSVCALVDKRHCRKKRSEYVQYLLIPRELSQESGEAPFTLWARTRGAGFCLALPQPPHVVLSKSSRASLLHGMGLGASLLQCVQCSASP